MIGYAIGKRIEELDTPALCIDAPMLERNIAYMANFLADKKAQLRPHTKTHKCPIIAWKQIRAGALGVTCAKLGEAEVMAAAGIDDILIANQIIGECKIRRLVALARRSDVMVAVERRDHAERLSAAMQNADLQLRVLIEVDVGMGRCGVEPGQATLGLAQQIKQLPGLKLCGIMGYEGHAVMIPDMAKRKKTAETAMAQLVNTHRLLEANGIPCDIVSAGGTGTFEITGSYPGVTEIQAGSYATMDHRYADIVTDFEEALYVTAQVISTREENQAVIDAGLKTLTSEFGLPHLRHPEGWQITHLSEEHGALKRVDGQPLKVGEKVQIIPSHGCTTINLHNVYHVVRDGVVEDIWPIAARGCVR